MPGRATWPGAAGQSEAKILILTLILTGHGPQQVPFPPGINFPGSKRRAWVQMTSVPPPSMKKP